MNEILLPTEQDDLKIRQLTLADARAYFEALDANRDHVSQFDEKTSAKYPDLESVEASIANPPNPAKLRFGIWKGDTFVGSINISPYNEVAEIGYWLDGRYTGHGYATLALKSVSKYALDHIGRPYAWVKKGNSKSVAVLERAGYVHTHNNGNKLVFSLDSTKQTSPGFW